MGKLNMRLQSGIQSEEMAFEKGGPADAGEKNGKREGAAKKQSFSFRADRDDISRWKLYAETLGTKDLGRLWSAAIDEYISRHALSAEQQKVYEMKKEAARMQQSLQ